MGHTGVSAAMITKSREGDSGARCGSDTWSVPSADSTSLMQLRNVQAAAMPCEEPVRLDQAARRRTTYSGWR